MIGHEKTVMGCTRGGLDWILGRISSWSIGQALERAAQRSGGVPVPELFKRHMDVALRDMV